MPLEKIIFYYSWYIIPLKMLVLFSYRT